MGHIHYMTHEGVEYPDEKIKGRGLGLGGGGVGYANTLISCEPLLSIYRGQ